MTESSYPWSETGGGDDAGTYTDQQWRQLHLDMMRFADGALEGLRVQATDPASKSVEITLGAGYVQGVYYRSTADETETIDDNTSGSTRYDRIVLRMDWANERVRLAVLKGTPGGGSPALTQTAGVLWEISLAVIELANGFSTIADGDITDEREWTGAHPVGSVQHYGGITPPAGWLKCDGSAVSRTSYADLFDCLDNAFVAEGALTTRTDDDTGVITVVGGNRGLTTSDTVDVYWAAGSRTGMSITNVAGADITVDGGSGDVLPSGGSAVWVKPASNVFLLPDARGRVLVGPDNLGGTSADRLTDTEADTPGRGSGEEDHTQSTAEIAQHKHEVYRYTGGSGQTFQQAAYNTGSQQLNPGTQYAGSSTPFNVTQPYVTMGCVVIKY